MIPASSMSRLEGRKRSVTLIVTILVGIVVVALIGLEYWSRFNARESQLTESKIATSNVAYASSEHAENTLTLIDSILWGLVERIEQDDVVEADTPRMRTFLAGRVSRTNSLQGLFVYDDKGRWIVNSLKTPVSNFNNADREYFIFHKEHDTHDVHIGRPVQSRSSGKWVLPMSRRLNHRDGTFAGVVLATLKIDYFQNFYNQFDIGKNGAILLALSDGTLVTRRPFWEGLIGSNIVRGPVFTLMRENGLSGTSLLVSKLDNVERMYSYRRLQAYPLVVAAALSKDEILEQWLHTTVIESSAVAVLLLIILFTGSRIFVQVRIRDRLEQDLRIAKDALEISNSFLLNLAMKDGLTGLSNRRHLDTQLKAELSRAARMGQSLALIMIDVDHFKRFNDTYGHQSGDGCLHAVSQIVASACKRQGDIAARFGGEEFSILLPDTDVEGAYAVATAVCREIRGMAFPHSASAFGIVTVSAGVSAFIPGFGHTPEMLIKAADGGLYMAKSEGRNRVSMNLADPLAGCR